MSIAREKYDRRILPRWHASSQLGELQELTEVRPTKKASLETDDRAFRESKFQFEQTPTIGHAADFLSVAIVTPSAETDIARVAEFLLKQADTLSPGLHDLAKHCAGQSSIQGGLEQSTQLAIASARKILRINPRNPLVLADLARHYAAGGNKAQAIKHMRVALALAPNHRWMIRTAVRCFAHCEDPQRAHKLLAQHPRTKQDPWLVAAELATAQVANHPPIFWRQANQTLQWGGLRPEHVSELATAVAMYELESDGARRARKHLSKGLIVPTENTLAQIAWAVQHKHLTGITTIDELVESNQCAHEAEFHRRTAQGDYLKAMEACQRWSASEPFAARPYNGLTFLSSILDDYEHTIHYADKVMNLDGRLDLTTRLNKIYAEVSKMTLNQTSKHEWFRDELYALMKEGETTHLLANLGLWYFRAGMRDNARAAYEKSIEMSVKQGQLEQASTAAVFFAREAILAKEADAEILLGKAKQLVDRARNKAGEFYLRKLTALIAAPDKASYILSPASAQEFIEMQLKDLAPKQEIRLIRGGKGPIALVTNLPRK